MSRNRSGDRLAARKAALLAESARTREDLRAQLSPSALRNTPAARLLDAAGSLLREPVVIGAVAVGVVALGPRRLLRALRWAIVTMPLHPLGRRLIPALGTRLLDAISDATRPRR